MNKLERYNKINSYFNHHFSQYSIECEWLTDTPEGNWRFEIPSLLIEVTLLLNDDGSVTEIRVPAYGTRLSQRFIKELWHKFGDVPMNPETEQIEEGFYIWNAGTDREDIWHWFDEHYDRGVVALCYPEE